MLDTETRSTVLARILTALDADEDGTLDLMAHPLPERGYFVGGNGQALVFDDTDSAMFGYDSIARFLSETHARFVGWWRDSEDGKIYIDGSDWFTSRAAAQSVAERRGEIAYWDVANSMEIRTAA